MIEGIGSASSHEREMNRKSSKKRPFERIAFVNHGQEALHLIRVVRELNYEQHLSLSTVALFTESDCQAKIVREADDAVSIGPAAFFDHSTGQRKSSNLDRKRIEQALISAKADSVWAGWGPFAEKSWFAELCQQLELEIVGHILRSCTF